MSASDEQAGDGGEQGRVRQLALSVGDLHEVLAPRIAEVVQAPAEERDRIARSALEALRARQHLTNSEVDRVTELLRNIRTADASPAQRADAAESIMRQLDASGASPLALAIASVAAKSARSVANSLERADTAGDVAADIGDFSTWQECACAGAIVGATGGAVVGLLGAGPIAVVELAAAGAVAGAAGFAVAEALLS